MYAVVSANFLLAPSNIQRWTVLYTVMHGSQTRYIVIQM